jgi:hypothetical protein
MAKDDEDYGYGNPPPKRERKLLFKLPEGMKLLKFDKVATIKLDIIPFRNKEGKAQIGMSYRVHKFGPKGKFSVVCPKHTAGLPCPICEAQFDLMNGKKFAEMQKDVQNAYKALFPQERTLHNVRLTDGTFRVWDGSDFKVKKAIAEKAKLFEAELEADGVAGPFKWASVTNGWMVKFDTAEEPVPGNTEGKTFFDVKNFDFKERKEQFDASIVDEMVKLDDALVIEPYEVIEKLYYTQEDDRVGEVIEDEEQEEVKPEPAKETVKPVAKAEPVEEKKAVIGKPEVSNNKKGLECPFDGRFGKDFKQLDECAEKCDLYSECRLKNKELKAQAVGEDDIPF